MKNKKGFTLAEVLITLTVIGIIAAITIMIINSNIKKAEIEAKLKKAVSVLNSAIYKATIDYGPPDQWPEMGNNTDYKIIAQKYIAPYLTTLKPVKDISLKDLGYKSDIKAPNGSKFARMGSSYTNRYPVIILNDGTTFLKIYYGARQFEYIIDINGPKGPNVAGKDVFQLAIDTTKQTPIARMFILKTQRRDSETGEIYFEDNTSLNTDNSCGKAGQYCGWLIERNGYKIPDDYPIKI